MQIMPRLRNPKSPLSKVLAEALELTEHVGDKDLPTEVSHIIGK